MRPQIPEVHAPRPAFLAGVPQGNQMGSITSAAISSRSISCVMTATRRTPSSPGILTNSLVRGTTVISYEPIFWSANVNVMSIVRFLSGYEPRGFDFVRWEVQLFSDARCKTFRCHQLAYGGPHIAIADMIAATAHLAETDLSTRSEQAHGELDPDVVAMKGYFA